jgi:hypothetical protein
MPQQNNTSQIFASHRKSLSSCRHSFYVLESPLHWATGVVVVLNIRLPPFPSTLFRFIVRSSSIAATCSPQCEQTAQAFAWGGRRLSIPTGGVHFLQVWRRHSCTEGDISVPGKRCARTVAIAFTSNFFVQTFLADFSENVAAVRAHFTTPVCF